MKKKLLSLPVIGLLCASLLLGGCSSGKTNGGDYEEEVKQMSIFDNSLDN